MAKIKICGLSRPEDILAVNEAEPDYIGFVFARSKRRVDAEQAERLKAMLNPAIRTVGVFVNAGPEEILDLEKRRVLDLIQLHGDEDEEYIRQVKRRFGLPVIKAVRVKDGEDVRRADGLPCDYLLLDTYVPDRYGGSGRAFDWSVIPRMDHPFFLAGGLRSGHLKEAAATGAYCLDLSSAAETGGVKDAGKIMKIVKEIRSV